MIYITFVRVLKVNTWQILGPTIPAFLAGSAAFLIPFLIDRVGLVGGPWLLKFVVYGVLATGISGGAAARPGRSYAGDGHAEGRPIVRKEAIARKEVGAVLLFDESNRAAPPGARGDPRRRAHLCEGRRPVPRGRRPASSRAARGCHVWDADGNEFIEYGMGLRSVTLGHAYPPVVEAVRAAARPGTQLHPPGDRSRSSAPSASWPRSPTRRDGQVREERLRRRRPPRSSSRARTPGATGRHLRRPPVLLDRRLVHRHDRDAGRDPRRDPRADRRVPLQRPRQRRGAVRRAPGPDRLRDARARDAPSRRAGLPAGLQELCRPARRAADLRRDDHRLPLAPGGRAGRVRRRRRTSRPSARRSATASRSRRWPAGARSWSAAGCTTDTSASSCCRRRTAPRRTLWPRRWPRSTIYERGARHRAPAPPGRAAAPRASRRRRGGTGVEDFFGVARPGLQPDLRDADADGEPSQPFRTLFLQELIRRGVIAPRSWSATRTATPTSTARSRSSTARCAVYAKALDDGVVLSGRPSREARLPPLRLRGTPVVAVVEKREAGPGGTRHR